eukprot:36099-Chlamydomonas_euryale.AAC.1
MDLDLASSDPFSVADKATGRGQYVKVRHAGCVQGLVSLACLWATQTLHLQTMLVLKGREGQCQW